MNPPVVGIIDYGAGNFASVWNAFAREECELIAIDRPGLLGECSHVVLPGVGTFRNAIDALGGMGILEPLRRLLREREQPFLGICVGMQILAERGSEPEETDGLGFVPGRVDKFEFRAGEDEQPPLPHIGWNEVECQEASVLLKGVDPEDSTFYFVHSYHLSSGERGFGFSYSRYGYRFISALEVPPVFGVQFHPEKSGTNGRHVIRNFIAYR